MAMGTMGNYMPVIVFLVFSMISVGFDILSDKLNTVYVKSALSCVILLILFLLCIQRQYTVAWIIVLVPFFFLSVIVFLLLYAFGLNVSTGTLTSFPELNEVILVGIYPSDMETSDPYIRI